MPKALPLWLSPTSLRECLVQQKDHALLVVSRAGAQHLPHCLVFVCVSVSPISPGGLGLPEVKNHIQLSPPKEPLHRACSAVTC